MSIIRRAGFAGRSALPCTFVMTTLLATLAPPRALAQQEIGQSASTPSQALPEISVSATGTPTPLSDIASSVTVITAADIEREQRRTLPDALQKVPGLNIVQIGGPGGQTSVFIRGTNSNHVKVLIDGIDVTDPSNANRSFDFGQLLTDDIARIEVLRGPQSGLYGADAIGGVISVVTKKGEGPPKVTFKTEAGSYGTFNQAGTLSGSQENFNYFFGVQHFRAETTPVTPPELVPAGRRINPNNYDNLSYTTKMGIDFNEYFTLNYTARYIDSRLLLTSDGGFPSTPSGFRTQQDDAFFFNRGEAAVTLLDGRFKNFFGINYSNFRTMNQEPPTAFGPVNPTYSLGDRLKFDYRGEFALAPGHTLVFGAERDEETLNTKVLRAQNGNSAGYIQLQNDYEKRFFLVSNLRYDDNDRFGSALTYRVAPAAIIPGTETKLKASVGTGFKAPTLNQLFVSFPDFNFFANPNLKPEESFGWDAGFEQPLFDDRVRFGATYFDNDIRNLIAAQFFTGFSQNVNIGRASAYGVESFVGFKITDDLQAQVTWTNTTTKDEIKHQELLRRPRNKVATTIEWRPFERFALSTTVIAIGTQVDGNRGFSIPRLKTNPYVLVNLAANYAATDYLTFFARVDNLFDARVQDPTGYLRPGASAYAGLKITN